jgi:hypothetical protein
MIDPVLFWSRTKRVGACLIWTGQIGNDGYGRIKFAGKSHRANRIAWELTRDPIPPGMFVCHDCPGGDNRACVEPSHLWLGTAAENEADMRAKGRQRYIGPKHPATGDRNGSRMYPDRLIRGEAWALLHGNDSRAGESNPRARLTVADVAVIRSEHAAGLASYSVLAHRYGVNKNTIAKIIRRENWR